MFQTRMLRMIVTAAFAVFFAVSVAAASDADRLLDLLVKKQLVTEQEAAALREEIEKDRTSERAQALLEKQIQDTERSEYPMTGTTAIKLSGWAQARWTNAVGTTNPLEVRRARLALDGNLGEKVVYRLQADLVRSPDLLDARLDLNLLPQAKLTFGQFKIPFSQENLLSSRDLISIERSLVVSNLVPGRDNGSNGRDIGAQLEGNFSREDGRPVFGYSFGVFNGAGTNRRDDNRRKDFAARLVAYPLPKLSIAVDYYNGGNGIKPVARERAGLELAYQQKLYSIRGEYIRGRDGSLRKNGWYTQFAYRFRPQWETVFKFDRYDPDRAARQDQTDTVLAGVNWYASKWVKFQANYGLVDQQARSDLTQTFLTQAQFQF